MNESVKILFGLIGGLALFLYGMNSMSDALQKASKQELYYASKDVKNFIKQNSNE